jgi:hypothetical protein
METASQTILQQPHRSDVYHIYVSWGCRLVHARSHDLMFGLVGLIRVFSKAPLHTHREVNTSDIKPGAFRKHNTDQIAYLWVN